MYICFDQHLLMDRKPFIVYMFTWNQTGRNKFQGSKNPREESKTEINRHNLLFWGLCPLNMHQDWFKFFKSPLAFSTEKTMYLVGKVTLRLRFSLSKVKVKVVWKLGNLSCTVGPRKAFISASPFFCYTLLNCI